jgi:hypothetical protein
MRLTILECDPNSTLAQTSPCADPANLTAFLDSHANFVLTFYFVNVLVNPSDPTEVTYYLEDRNYVPFTTTFTG